MGAIFIDEYRWKRIVLLEAAVCIDHILMLIKIPPKNERVRRNWIFKRSENFDELCSIQDVRYKHRSYLFWSRGYYGNSFGKNAKKLEENIENQLEEVKVANQLTLKVIDLFTDSKK